MVVAYVFFFLAGLGFGYAAPGWTKAIPVLFPLVLAGASFAKYDGDGDILARLILALVLMVGGILLGALLAGGGRRQAPA